MAASCNSKLRPLRVLHPAFREFEPSAQTIRNWVQQSGGTAESQGDDPVPQLSRALAKVDHELDTLIAAAFPSIEKKAA